MFLSLYFSLMAHTRCKLRVTEQATISDMKNMEIGMPSNVSFVRYNAELYVSRTVSATPQQKLSTTGSARSASHGISLSEHYRASGPDEERIAGDSPRIQAVEDVLTDFSEDRGPVDTSDPLSSDPN